MKENEQQESKAKYEEALEKLRESDLSTAQAALVCGRFRVLKSEFGLSDELAEQPSGAVLYRVDPFQPGITPDDHRAHAQHPRGLADRDQPNWVTRCHLGDPHVNACYDTK